MKSGFANKAEPTSWVATAPVGADATSSTSTPSGLGLGFNMPPQTAVRVPRSDSSEETAKPDPSNLPRLRSATGHGLAMDLAGISSIGDAASHASMIMQSRQAKVQRWRPASAGLAVSGR